MVFRVKFSLSGGIQSGMTIRMGQPLMKLPDPSPT
jgi:hypothetical protein